MLNKQIRECLLGILVVCGLASGASAQRMLPLMDIEPGEFNADYQLFSPLQTDDFIDGFKANTGWFFTYDRTYFRTTRPDAEASFMQSDRTWGNRFDFGYMTSQGHGWYFSVLDLSGPNVSERIRQERNNRFVEGSPQEEPIDPPQDNNNRETGARDYFLNDTLNVATLSNFEINKTFRREPRSNGSIVEPFVGFRMGRFTDFYRNDEYNRYDDEGNPVPLIPDPNDPDSPAPDDAAIEEYISSNANLSNNMFGGQIGTRWYNKKGRWMLSGELKAFAMANLQHLEDRTFTTITLVDVGTDNDVDTETRQFITSYASANEFVVGGEIRAEAAYEVTRDFSLRFGFELLEFGKGIGRGNDITQNTQSTTLYGLTFGCTLNR
ncbi:MAG: hypothetical protein VB855_07875 [Pirellulaceae bacterium]